MLNILQSDLETDVLAKLTTMLKALEKKSGKDGDINRVNELIKVRITYFLFENFLIRFLLAQK